MALFPTKTQPQVSQIELRFPGPLVKDTIVETPIDLTTFNKDLNYDHKLVWVKQEQTFYFLISGSDGTILNHWQKLRNNLVTIEPYDYDLEYTAGSVVLFQGSLWASTNFITQNQSPADYPDRWQKLLEGIRFERFIFENVSSVVIKTTIKNPTFQIMIGTLLKASNGSIVLDEDRLPTIINYEFVDCHYKETPSLSDNSGVAYTFSFESNELPTLLTGAINVK